MCDKMGEGKGSAGRQVNKRTSKFLQKQKEELDQDFMDTEFNWRQVFKAIEVFCEENKAELQNKGNFTKADESGYETEETQSLSKKEKQIAERDEFIYNFYD